MKLCTKVQSVLYYTVPVVEAKANAILHGGSVPHCLIGFWYCLADGDVKVIYRVDERIVWFRDPTDAERLAFRLGAERAFHEEQDVPKVLGEAG